MASIVKFPVVKTSVVGPSRTVAPGVLPIAGTRQDTAQASDIKLVPSGIGYDFELNSDGDFDLISGFDSAILVSIFAEKRASGDERQVSIHRRGWLGNEFLDPDANEVGSKVWLFKNSRLNSKALNGISDKAKISLEWMVTEGFAREVDASANKTDNTSANLDIKITRPSGNIDFRSIELWNGTPDT